MIGDQYFGISTRLMRTLLVIPIIHTEQDMGSLQAQMKQAYVSQYGHEKWLEHLKSIDALWLGIRQLITALALPYPYVRLYQDGLPVCEKEAEIVRDVATQGSKNHQLLLELMAQGAHLMGTEDPRLLLEEYQLHKAALSDLQPGQTEQRQDLSRRLLFDRDKFIAQRINTTLMPGETGLLFLGLVHAVEPFLRADMLVKHLLPSLRQRPGKSA